MTVTYDEGVFEELVNLSAYLADDDDEVAQAFLNSCDATFRFLAANRYVGSQREFKNKKLAGVRMWRVKSFVKYLIFYVCRPKAGFGSFTYYTAQPTIIGRSKMNSISFLVLKTPEPTTSTMRMGLLSYKRCG